MVIGTSALASGIEKNWSCATLTNVLNSNGSATKVLGLVAPSMIT